MKHLDRYILLQFLKSFFLVVGLLSALICAVDFSEKNDDYIKHNLPYTDILEYYAFFVFYVLSYITPLTVFITTVFVTSRLAAHSEIIVIFSSGVSFWRFLYPYLLGSGTIALLSFYLHGWVVPNSNKDRLVFENKYLKKAFQFDQNNVRFKVHNDVFLYLRSYDNTLGRANSVTLEHITEDGVLQARLSATYMVWDSIQHKWELQNWRLRELNPQGECLSRGERLDTTLYILPQDFTRMDKFQETLTMKELTQHIAVLKERGDTSVIQYELEKYARYMQPFAVLLLTFMGVLVSARKNREGTGLLLAFGLLIVFVYLIFFILAKSMAEVGSITPQVSVALPNLIFAAFTWLLYHKLPR